MKLTANKIIRNLQLYKLTDTYIGLEDEMASIFFRLNLYFENLNKYKIIQPPGVADDKFRYYGRYSSALALQTSEKENGIGMYIFCDYNEIYKRFDKYNMSIDELSKLFLYYLSNYSGLDIRTNDKTIIQPTNKLYDYDKYYNLEKV